MTVCKMIVFAITNVNFSDYKRQHRVPKVLDWYTLVLDCGSPWFQCRGPCLQLQTAEEQTVDQNRWVNDAEQAGSFVWKLLVAQASVVVWTRTVAQSPLEIFSLERGAPLIQTATLFFSDSNSNRSRERATII